MRDFKKLKIWQMGMEIVEKAYDLSKGIPKEELFGMKSQITRCAVSIPANIAEGSAKKSDKDNRRFVEISLGSAYELETHLLIVQKRKWLKDELVDEALNLVIREQMMIAKFLETLES